jgi:hypothetical protein
MNPPFLLSRVCVCYLHKISFISTSLSSACKAVRKVNVVVLVVLSWNNAKCLDCSTHFWSWLLGCNVVLLDPPIQSIVRVASLPFLSNTHTNIPYTHTTIFRPNKGLGKIAITMTTIARNKQPSHDAKFVPRTYKHSNFQ